MSDMDNARKAAILAVQYDKEENVDAAVKYYRIAARLLDNIRNNVPPDELEELCKKVREYHERATLLQSKKEDKMQQLKAIMREALEADEAGSKDLAVERYADAVQLALSIKTDNSSYKEQIDKLATQALQRAEEIKGISNKPIRNTGGLTINRPIIPSVSPNRSQLHREQSAHLEVSGGTTTYTEEEKIVLTETSTINGICFLPFMERDLQEKFECILPFEEKHTLKLSSKQEREFSQWIRPEEISSDPKMILNDCVDCYSIKQTIVSDCSFVASLAVSAMYERRFHKKIITSIIYPQNRFRQPVYNSCGKYMVKLHLNGILRKVIIDDRLPYSRHGSLLCSYSSNKDEFWVSILEKAYMKVMGGYDFPGSNSNIDLHALTGWVPERCTIRANEPDFNADKLFETIRTKLQDGHVLVTVATGALSDAEAERTGLVASHAYAVLDVRLVNGVKLLKLKNPWSHLRWRGNYSELRLEQWTPSLQEELNYDPKCAAQYDNGVFWIDYASILNFFEVFYLNWNPKIFHYTYCIHQKWDAGKGPVKDAYTIGENPQFSLHVKGKGAVWLLLTRHITEIDDFKDNKEYITLLVYKNNGNRVYYPYDPPPFIDGIRINSPHYLCKVIVGDGSADRYTLVVSQYEKTKTIYYTLRAYATCPFSLAKLEPYVHRLGLNGEWVESNAGGCLNHPTYRSNPKFLITVPNSRVPCNVVVEMKGPKQYQIGVDVTVKALEDPNVTAPFLRESSGAYRNGYVVLQLYNLPAGEYFLTPSTYYPGQIGPFILELRSTCKLTCEGHN